VLLGRRSPASVECGECLLEPGSGGAKSAHRGGSSSNGSGSISGGSVAQLGDGRDGGCDDGEQHGGQLRDARVELGLLLGSCSAPRISGAARSWASRSRRRRILRSNETPVSLVQRLRKTN
jgi:hypothetical protein